MIQMRSVFSFSKEFPTNLGLILTTACYQAGWATSLYRDCAAACSRLVPHTPPHPSSGIRTDYDELALTHGPGFLGRNAPARMLFDVTYLDDAATRASVGEVLRRSPSIESMEYHENTGISVFDMVEGMTLAYGIVSPGTLPFALNSCDEAGEYVPIFEGLVAEVSLRDQLDGTACDASGQRALRELGMRLCQLFLRAHHSDEPLYGKEPGFPRAGSLYLTEETEGLYGFTLKMLVPSSALVAMARPGTPSQNGQVLASLLGALMLEAYCAHGFIAAAREASSGPQ